MKRPTFVEVLGDDHQPQEPNWLIEGVIPAAGLCGVHGTPRTGRTSLVIQLVRAMRGGAAGGGILTRRVSRGDVRVLVLAGTRAAGDRYWEAFKGDDGVAVARVSMPAVTDPTPWQEARDIRAGCSAELVVIDPMPMCLPEQVPGVKAEIDLFDVPVIGVFMGAGGTQSVKPDDWRSEFDAGVHLRSDKGTTLALNVYSHYSVPAETRVVWEEAGRRFVAVDETGNPIPDDVARIGAEQVAELAGRAKYLSSYAGTAKIVAERLLAEDYNAVVKICARVPRAQEIADAISEYADAWQAVLNPGRLPLPDEPPF